MQIRVTDEKQDDITLYTLIGLTVEGIGKADVIPRH